MADLRRGLGNFTTPAGRLVAPLYLNEPDGKFDDSPSKLKFKAGILLDGPEAAAFLAEVWEMWESWMATVKAANGKKPKVMKKNVQWFTPDTPRWDDIGESTAKTLDNLQEGEAIFKTSMKAVMTRRDGTEDSRTPKFFDASANLLPDVPLIGYGTTARLNGSFYGWTNAGSANMSLLLHAVQIIDLREPGVSSGDAAEDYGFEATAGFVMETETFPVAGDNGGDF